MNRKRAPSTTAALILLLLLLGACGTPGPAQTSSAPTDAATPTSPVPTQAAIETPAAERGVGIEVELEPVPTVQVYYPTLEPVVTVPAFRRTRVPQPTATAAPTEAAQQGTRFFEVREATIVAARKLNPIGDGVCAVATRPGQSNGALLIQGNILGPTEVYVGGDLLIGLDGKILCVGADCTRHQAANDATRIVCPGAVVSPGLVNAHDHIVFDHWPPADWGDERYDHRHDWRKGLREHTRIDCDGIPDNEQWCRLDDSASAVAWTEVRQLMSGTTSLASDPNDSGFPGLLRNIDWYGKYDGGLEDYRVDIDTFPFDDTDGEQFEVGCGYPIFEDMSAVFAQLILDQGGFSFHVAEGVDRVAQNEFTCLSGQQLGAVDGTHPDTSFVHTMAVRAPDAQILKDSSTSVIWSPRSNISLYGATTPVTLMANLGIWRIALSTDWTPTGSMNLLRELECAGYYNSKHLDGYFTDYELWKMVTVNAAVALNLEDQIGMLKEGYFADVAIFAGKRGTNYHRAVIDADPEDVVLVVRSGMPQYGDTEIMSDLRIAGMMCAEIPGGVCRQDKTLCMQESSSLTLADLYKANRDALPLFYCDTPRDEPSCVPMRPADEWGCGQYPLAYPSQDSDGDGVEDPYDNCPTIFNPVLPLDGFYATNPEACRQADYDGDGLGDACDPDPTGE